MISVFCKKRKRKKKQITELWLKTDFRYKDRNLNGKKRNPEKISFFVGGKSIS